MKSRITLSALVVAGLALAACGSDDTADDATSDSTASDSSAQTSDGADSAGGGTPTAGELDNRSYSSTEVSGYELVADSSITISFEADSMAANAGCNTLAGGFSFDEDRLLAGPFAMTMMACDDGLMDQDTWLSDFLVTEPKITLVGTTLTLTGADNTTVVLEEVADAELDGIEWKLTGLVSNDAVSSVPTESTASVTFTGPTVLVNSGCNTGSGAVVVGEDTIAFEAIATTKMACEPDVMETEATMLGVLDGDASYEIDGNMLSITSSDGSTGLQFTADS